MKPRRFTKEEVDRADNASIVGYINSLNLDTKRTGKTIKVEDYGGLHINPVNNEWYCHSKGEGGGPIQLVKFLENKTWVEAVKTLLGNSYESNIVKTNHKDVQSESKKEFLLPKKNNTFNHVIAYLIKTRCIDKDIVYNCIQNKTLYEDEKRNCVFVGYDREGTPRYAGLRGTNTNVPFKGEVNNSDKTYSFNFTNEDSNKIYVFESPIELMSYMSIHKIKFKEDFNHNAISLGGVSDVALEKYLEDNPNIYAIELRLNNDKAGKTAMGIIGKKLDSYEKYFIGYDWPTLKDYNEDLVSIHKLLKKKSSEKELEKEEREDSHDYEMEL